MSADTCCAKSSPGTFEHVHQMNHLIQSILGIITLLSSCVVVQGAECGKLAIGYVISSAQEGCALKPLDQPITSAPRCN